VGGYVAGLPAKGNVHNVLEQRKLVLLNTEPELDCADPRAATRALQNADFVVSLTPYKTGLEYADVLLPITAFTETAGTFVSMEGRVQSFYATVNPLGDARPGWKVLRVLGTMLGRPGSDIDTVEEARNACLNGRDVAKLLSNRISLESKNTFEKAQGLQRVADVPIYFADPLVRRSPPLQRTKDAWAPKARMNAKLMTRLGLSREDSVLIRQEGGQARLKAVLDDRVPDECVRVAAAHPSTASLGAMFGALEVEKAG
jgi:NADH-quinone oxidoreductase subunit G